MWTFQMNQNNAMHLFVRNKFQPFRLKIHHIDDNENDTHNGQLRMYKRTNNDLYNTAQKMKD